MKANSVFHEDQSNFTGKLDEPSIDDPNIPTVLFEEKANQSASGLRRGSRSGSQTSYKSQ